MFVCFSVTHHEQLPCHSKATLKTEAAVRSVLSIFCSWLVNMQQILFTTRQKHTCMVCLISIGAKLYRTLALQEQDWAQLACDQKKNVFMVNRVL